jgi:4-amino-4-deoxy-L-arabinose transferase-like glycosyltransferase
MRRFQGLVAVLASPKWRAVTFILLLAFLVRFSQISWSYSNNGIDEGIMLQRSSLVASGYDIYSEIPCDQAPLAFLIGAVFDGDVVMLRVLVSVLSMLALIACMESARRMNGTIAMLATGVLLSVDFAFLRESRLFSLDGLASAFLAFAILLFILYIRKDSRTALVASGLFIGLSTSTKLIGALGLVGVLLFLLLDIWRRKDVRRRRSLDLVIVVVSSAVPLAALMVVLGPSEMVQGMVFNQGHRVFEPFLKLSIVAFFGLNLAYMLPLVHVRALWKAGPELRFLLTLVAAMLVFFVAQPLVFFHHMAILSPAMAILAGVVLAEVFSHKKSNTNTISLSYGSFKGIDSRRFATALFVVGLLVSGGLAVYGPIAQDKPSQLVYSETLRGITSSSDWVICGDPLIAAYAGRNTPPEVVNVAYRVYPDVTTADVEIAVLVHDVAVVVICYRLNDMQGLPDFLSHHDYALLDRDYVGHGADGALDLFEKGIGQVSFYVRNDIVIQLGLPVQAEP